MGGNNGSLATRGHDEYTTATQIIHNPSAWLWLLLFALAGITFTSPQSWILRDAQRLLLVTAWLRRREIVDAVRLAFHLLVLANPIPLAASCAVILWGFRVFSIKAHSSDEATTTPFLPPLILPCHTTHTRFFPAKHSFTYSYLQVGIPIGWRNASGMLSCDPASDARRRWFSVHNEDYLARGMHAEGLRGKLVDFLHQHDVSAVDLPYAYLVTAPRFLGWSFNPVSFWYLYDSAKTLKAMILEVNNTFDERRMYLLRPDASMTPETLRHTWEKDFHVSPFNDRTGTYSVVAADPFGEADWCFAEPADKIRIDNNITLSSPPPDTRAKLVARLNSTATSINPAKMTFLQMVIFMWQWSWTGFLTNPRILWEARILWAKKKLQVFYRPEIHIGSIGRQEQKEELTIEKFFRWWLERLAEQEQIQIEYISAAGDRRGKVDVLGHQPQQMPGKDILSVPRLEVLSPEWYADIARAHDVRAVFDRRAFKAIEGEITLNANTAAKSLLLGGWSEQKALACERSAQTSWRLRLAQRLSSRSAALDPKPAVPFRRLLEPSLTNNERDEYDQAVLTITLADTFALGYTGLLRGYVELCRYGVILLMARYLASSLPANTVKEA